MDQPGSGPISFTGEIPPVPPPVARAATGVPLDAGGRIATDLVCRRCGYNLRTQHPDARCPECNSAVGLSMHGDYLRFADPAWVDKLARGINWILLCSILVALASAAAGIGVGIMGFSRSLAMVLGAALGLPMLYGYWLATTPDPSGFGEGSVLNARQLTRGIIISQYFANQLFQFAAPAAPLVASIGALVLSTIGLVGTIAMYLYARQLALRIPDPDMARGFRITLWGMSIVTILGFLMSFAAIVFARGAGAGPMAPVTTTAGWTSTTMSASGSARVTVTSPSPGAIPLGFLAVSGCAVGILALVFGIWSLVLALRLRKALNQASQEAWQTWAAAPGGQGG